MGVSTTNFGVVFIHGLFSSEKTWDPLARLLESDEELASVTVRRFGYASPKLRRFRPDRRTADYNDLADRLKAFLHYEAVGHDRLVLVAHSQGGLIVQRYLARMINSGEGQQLSKIRGVMLFACPNDGSDFMLPLRSAWWPGHPQVRALTPLNPHVKDAQRTVLDQIVYAQGVGASSCPIPFWVFGGSEDKVVVRASAQGVFPHVFMLPGDHFSIIKPKTHRDPAYVALRTHLLDVQQQADPADPGAAASNPSTSAAQTTPWGDGAKAARILDVLPPYADWLKTLRTQDFFVVSGRVNRLVHEAADALRNDPLQFIDPALRDAATACSSAATDLSEAMIDLLFADRVDAKASEDLPAREKEDAWTLFLGEHQRGESELRLQTLRNVFFETYDALMRLLNERLLAPEGTTSPPRGTTLATVDPPPATPNAADRQPRVGQGLPMYERELRVAYDQLRSAGIEAPASDAYLSGTTAVQHFVASEERGPGWVLTLRNDRAIAVSEPLWSALVRAGRPAADDEPLNAVGHPTASGTEPTVLGPDVQRVALEGGSWGKGWLVHGDHGWRWEPQVNLHFNQTRSATNWTAAQPAPQLRLRAVITLPWDTLEEVAVTPERRRDLKAKLPISQLAGAVTTLSLRRGGSARRELGAGAEP
ncbi:alpha/beta fold hydrolase [Streptomyces sp. NPDC056580]|uniref:alpha/beta fold hydrolase n=1 Tax=Streptomyces sp. NPDC056580 TaxID=3345872 RepID=UPI0036749C53